MQNTSATTAEEYIAALPDARRAAITAVRTVVKAHLPQGFAEVISFGMINYAVPLERFPGTYNGQPLCYVALAAQKNYCSLYLMSVYGDKAHEEQLREGFRASGKRMDMGKSCVRFRTADDLPLDVVGELVASVSVDKWIAIYQESRKGTAKG